MYSMSKAWILLESEPLTSFVKAKIKPIDDGKQQSFTSGFANVTPDSANDLGSIPLICQQTITPGLAQISSVLPPEWL